MTEDLTKNKNLQVMARSGASSKSPDKWLTKDRSWNFVFWLFISLSSSIAWNFARVNPTFAKLLFFAPLIGMPIMLKIFNSTKIAANKKFLNSENIEITSKQLPTILCCLLPLNIIITTFVLIRVTGIYLCCNIFMSFGPLISFLFLFSSICWYFIIKNCPISIILNPAAWNFTLTPHGTRRSSSNSFSCMNKYFYERTHSPRYSHLGSNIYHRK